MTRPRPRLATDPRLLTIAVIGLVVLTAVAGAVVLLYQGKPAEALVTIASTALGILTPSPLSRTSTPPG